MLSYQSSLYKETCPLTAEIFTQLIISDETNTSIKEIRSHIAEAEKLERAVKEPTLEFDGEPSENAQKVAEHRKAAAALKRKLPIIIWQATFGDSYSSKGRLGHWRKQTTAKLNGLFMLDIDHISPSPSLPQGKGVESELSPESAPVNLFNSWIEAYKKNCPLDADMQTYIKMWAEHYGILLVHVTPSGRGLRIVAKANYVSPTIEAPSGAALDLRSLATNGTQEGGAIGNLADNQAWLASRLGVDYDKSCKDASRMSFCPCFDDIKYINKDELFTYENPEFDEKFGPQYRKGYSQPTRGTGRSSSVYPDGAACPDVSPTGMAAQGGLEGREKERNLEERLKEGYHGKSFDAIVEAWFETILHGKPGTGDRHASLYKMACDLRHITDNDPCLLQKVLLQCDVGKAIAQERGEQEIADIASDACAKKKWDGLPRRLIRVLAAAGIQLDEPSPIEEGVSSPAFDYEAYWRRLQPLLSESPYLREAVADLPDHHKLAGVLAAGAMFGTYLTRTWWEHFDGKFYRLSYLVYIIGQAASGKSFLVDLDKLIMAPMVSADRIGRQAEKQWKAKEKQRKANEALPDRPHPVVRYCPSGTSNNVFYRRLDDAVDNDVMDPDTGEPLHLHLITIESEIATAVRSQIGNWAGKSDLELKAFHNESAGVDYANSESTNGIEQINWNQVLTGTLDSMSAKIKPDNVLNGLVTRLVLFLMPSNDYAMIPRRNALRNHERACKLRSVGFDLEKVKGELHVPRLVDFCYEYEAELTARAKEEQDLCLDYFRKRIPVFMMRYTIVRIVLRQLKAAIAGEDLVVEDSDLEFARLIGDWCLEAQIYLFGQMVMDALENERLHFTPRKMKDRVRVLYNTLSNRLTAQDLIKSGYTTVRQTAASVIHKWEDAGLIRKIKHGVYEKIVQKI